MRLKLQAAGLLRNGPPTSLLNFCGPSPRLLSLKYLQTTSLIIFSTTSLFQYPCPSGFAGIISGGSESPPIIWLRRRKSIRRKSFSGKNLRDWARRNTSGGAARVPFQKGGKPVVSAFRLNFGRNLCRHCCQLNGRLNATKYPCRGHGPGQTAGSNPGRAGNITVLGEMEFAGRNRRVWTVRELSAQAVHQRMDIFDGLQAIQVGDHCHHGHA